MNNKVIVILGTTASGKTGLSIELAKAYNGEIISSDSMQIYKYMNIGTAKPSIAEQQGIPHHMIDIIMPNENYTLGQYLKAARDEVDNVLKRGKVPFVVGGTGLYISSILDNINLCEASFDEEYRTFLSSLTGETLKELLFSVDPEKSDMLHQNDIKRMSRSLELYRQTTLLASQQHLLSKKEKSPYEFYVIGLTCENRDVLYARIDERVEKMFEAGLLNEVSDLYKRKLLEENSTSMQAIGYKEFIPYFKGETDIYSVKEKIKQESRRYAKRQLTWFKRDKRINWTYVDEYNTEKLIKKLKLGVDFFI